MKKKLSILVLVLLFSGVAVAIWITKTPAIQKPGNLMPVATETLLKDSLGQNPAKQVQESVKGAILVSEPVTYKNLQVFFLYGDAEIAGDKYVTLDEALKKKMVVVKETDEINELKMDNRSGQYIYINSGDIVRGGKQDRTIQYDVVIGPKMKNVNLASFCVEHDRWNDREGESVSNFSSSTNSLSSRELKVAAKLSKDQSAVWEKVEKYQYKANENITHAYSPGYSVDVKSSVSASSLELTLENKEIAKIKKLYRAAIIAKFTQKKNAVGIACFINGKISAIDIFNNHNLFEDMFDKLLDGAIAEAISENAVMKYTPADTATVNSFIKHAQRKLSSDEVNKITRFVTYKAGGHTMLFLTEDKNEKKWLHKNWLDTKEE